MTELVLRRSSGTLDRTHRDANLKTDATEKFHRALTHSAHQAPRTFLELPKHYSPSPSPLKLLRRLAPWTNALPNVQGGTKTQKPIYDLAPADEIETESTNPGLGTSETETEAMIVEEAPKEMSRGEEGPRRGPGIRRMGEKRRRLAIVIVIGTEMESEIEVGGTEVGGNET